MHGSRGEEDCGSDGCKVLGEMKTADVMDARFWGRGRLRMRWMQCSRGEEDSGCDGCNILAERKTADAIDAMF